MLEMFKVKCFKWGLLKEFGFIIDKEVGRIHTHLHSYARTTVKMRSIFQVPRYM